MYIPCEDFNIAINQKWTPKTNPNNPRAKGKLQEIMLDVDLIEYLVLNPDKKMFTWRK